MNTAADAPAATTDVPARATRREWLGLAVIALPCLLYAMDLTVLNLAVPALSAELKPTPSQLLWILDIYGFMVAGLLIPMGALGDRIGRRRLLLAGAAFFGVASVLAAFSTSAEMLIATRALLGIAGATVAPSTLSLIRNMFHDPRERTLAIGVWISSYSAGSAIGPVLGGVLLEWFWWGSVFLLAVPVMVLLLIVGPLLLPEYRDPAAGRMDLPSAALSLGAVLAVIYGVKRIAEQGPGMAALAAIAAGLAIGALFLRRQARLADPMIDLHLFRQPGFSAALAIYSVCSCVAFGVFIFLSQYLQLVLGLSPLWAGLWIVPFAAAFIAGSMTAPLLAARFGKQRVVVGGLLVAAAGFVMVALLERGAPAAWMATAFVVYSLGLAPVFTLATDLVVGSAPPERAGAASALSETGSEFGGALGIALLGSLGTFIYRVRMDAAGLPVDVAEAARVSLGGAVDLARQIGGAAGERLLVACQEAFMAGQQGVAWAAAAAMAGAALLAWHASRRRVDSALAGSSSG